MPRYFDEYARVLNLPGQDWPRACATFEAARATADLDGTRDEVTDLKGDRRRAYRLLTALDYYLQACDTANRYIRFLLLVIVAERLFSTRDADAGTKAQQISDGFNMFLGDATGSPDRTTLPKDYRVRNNLVHGPEQAYTPGYMEGLVNRWISWCSASLCRILVDRRFGELRE